MTDWLALGCLLGAVGFLVALAIIDLKTWLLPNKLVLPFAILAVLFHVLAPMQSLSLPAMAGGALAGGGVLWIIRAVANRYYGQDALGLGDVKLMGAAGLWLGVQGVSLALCVGATAGLIHGLVVAYVQSRKGGETVNLSRLQIPAGPGFVIGILVAGAMRYAAFRVGG